MNTHKSMSFSSYNILHHLIKGYSSQLGLEFITRFCHIQTGFIPFHDLNSCAEVLYQ